MCTISYYKLGNKWFFDFPEYLEKGSAEDLERIGSFHDFLELVSGNKSFVSFKMDVKPFEGANEMILTGSSGHNTGGYYHLPEWDGRKIDLELWYNSVIYSLLEQLPPKLYIQLQTE
jgi:hypothetical protein